MAKSVSDLIVDLKDRISLPADDDDRWSTTAIIRAFNNALEEQVTPELMSLAQEYLVVKEDIALRDADNNVLFPSLEIPVPKRSYGGTVREVKYLPSNSENPLNVPFTTIPETDTYPANFAGVNTPVAAYQQGEVLKIIADADTLDGTVIIYYYLEPSTIVNKTTEFAQITNLAYNTATEVFTFTVSSITGREIDTYATSDSSTVHLYDLYRASTGAILIPNLALTKASATSFTVTSVLDADDVKNLKAFQAGGMPVVAPYSSDLYLVPAESCQFSTIPYAFDQLLVLEAAGRVLESMGDTEGLQVNDTRIVNAKKSIISAMGNRVKGQRKKVNDRRNLATYQRGHTRYGGGGPWGRG